MSLDPVLLTGESDTQTNERLRCERAQAGDRVALGELLTQYGPRLYRQVLYPRLGSAALAEEALAATYLEVIQSLRAFRWLGVGVYPWLRQVALRVALRAVRKSAGETLFDPTDIAQELEAAQAESVAVGDDAHEQAAVRAYVERALEALGPSHAEALRLRLLEERSREELASLWQTTPNAVDQRVHRAKAALRTALRAHGDARLASPLLFVLVDGGSGPTAHVFNRAKVTLGRGSDADLKLPGEGVSRNHARLELDAKGVWIVDLGSSNGTLLRGNQLSGRATLALGDSIRIGGYRISIVATPLLSLWARSILAEAGATPLPTEDEGGPLSTGALAPTVPLSRILRREVLAPAGSRKSSPGEEMIETLLRAAWQSEELDDAFQARAVEAVLVTEE